MAHKLLSQSKDGVPFMFILKVNDDGLIAEDRTYFDTAIRTTGVVKFVTILTIPNRSHRLTSHHDSPYPKQGW